MSDTCGHYCDQTNTDCKSNAERGSAYFVRLQFVCTNLGTSTLMNPEDLEKLVTWQMPFGKFKGRLLADLPGSYLHWFARKGFPEGEIGRLLALMREIDHNGLNSLLEPLRKR
jgi:uncharacterized protein